MLCQLARFSVETHSTPPGRSVLYASDTNRLVLCKCSMTWLDVTTSNVSLGNGSVLLKSAVTTPQSRRAAVTAAEADVSTPTTLLPVGT